MKNRNSSHKRDTVSSLSWRHLLLLIQLGTNDTGNKRSKHLKLWINELAIILKVTKTTSDIFWHSTNYHNKLSYRPQDKFGTGMKCYFNEEKKYENNNNWKIL